MHVKSFVVSPIQSNCYVLAERLEADAFAVVVDPGDLELSVVFDYVEAQKLNVEAIWCTHGHFDHVLGVDVARKKYGVPVCLHKADLELFLQAHRQAESWLGQQAPALNPPDLYWEDEDQVTVGGQTLTIWHTPGHSPGGVCIIGDNAAFTGDTLFAGTIGRTDFPESNPQDMLSSLRRLLTLEKNLTLYPGHMQATTIEQERAANPFLANL